MSLWDFQALLEGFGSSNESFDAVCIYSRFVREGNGQLESAETGVARLGGRSRGIVVFPPKTVKASRLHRMSIPYGERIEIFNGPMSEGSFVYRGHSDSCFCDRELIQRNVGRIDEWEKAGGQSWLSCPPIFHLFLFLPTCRALRGTQRGPTDQSTSIF